MASKFDIISVDAIRPNSPTPPHLRIFKLSHWDLLIPPKIYATFIFFYRSDSNCTNQNNDALARFFSKSRLLKRALSKTLVHYYPLAGRLVNDTIIDCNDEGARFVEAHFGDNLFSFLNKPDAKLLSNFIPEVDASSVSRVVMVVQLTLFDCGGIAVSLHISHRLADASTFCTFIKSWMSMIHGDEKLLKPVFLESSSSPPEYFPKPDPNMIYSGDQFVTKRFVFHVSKIDAIKAKINSDREQKQPSNLNAVIAVIAKSAISASRFVSGTSGSTLLIQIANMRKRVSPPFPDNTIGNIVSSFRTLFEEEEIEISSLIRAMRRSSLTQFDEENKVERIRKLKDYYIASSLCKFPIYDTDCGWGKPLWVFCTPTFFKNLIVLMDTREGDGIEAWVCLDEKQMEVFERQKEIIAFASVNPSVVVNYSRM